MRRFLEILFGIVLFPLFLAIGLVYGIIAMYQAFNNGIEEAIANKRG